MVLRSSCCTGTIWKGRKSFITYVQLILRIWNLFQLPVRAVLRGVTNDNTDISVDSFKATTIPTLKVRLCTSESPRVNHWPHIPAFWDFRWAESHYQKARCSTTRRRRDYFLMSVDTSAAVNLLGWGGIYQANTVWLPATAFEKQFDQSYWL